MAYMIEGEIAKIDVDSAGEITEFGLIPTGQYLFTKGNAGASENYALFVSDEGSSDNFLNAKLKKMDESYVRLTFGAKISCQFLNGLITAKINHSKVKVFCDKSELEKASDAKVLVEKIEF